MQELLIVAGAGVVAVVMNALAGGGSFVTLPALIGAGLPSVVANASSTVALFPGGLLGGWAYGRKLEPLPGLSLGAMLAVSMAGGLIGSLLLIWTPSAAFDGVLPWLLLVATVTLALGPRLAPRLSRWRERRVGVGLAVQFALGVYAGYFGGAVGIMRMAAWTLLSEADIAQIQPLRIVMGAAANGVAVVVFALAGTVRWSETAALGLGALVGGYGGAQFGRRIPTPALRAVTVGLCVVVTVLFFVRAMRRP